jgi:hypothetical protein
LGGEEPVDVDDIHGVRYRIRRQDARNRATWGGNVNRKRILLWTLATGGTAAAAQWLPVGLETPAVPSAAVAETRQDAGSWSVAETRWSSLSARETMGRPAGELFVSQSWAPPPRPRRKAIAAPPPPPPKPEPPAVPYRVAGKLVHGDRPQIVLAKGDAVFMVREGDTLEDGYRVVAIGRDHVSLLYLPLGVQETVSVTSAFVIDRKFPPAETEPLASR